MQDNIDKAVILRNMQAGILRPLKKEYVKFLFIDFKKLDKKDIADVFQKFKPNSAADQQVNNKEDLLLNFFISPHIFPKLGYKKQAMQSSITRSIEKFEDGMRSRSLPSRIFAKRSFIDLGKKVLEHLNASSRFFLGMKNKWVREDHGDSKPEKWDEKFQKDLDVLITIAGNDLDKVAKKFNELVNYFKTKHLWNEGSSDGSQINIWEELGQHDIREVGDEKQYFEPFGYRDGITKIRFFKKNEQEAFELDANQLELVKDQFNGSFLVFRKLKQHVKKFHETVKDLSSEHGIDEKLLKGQIMGRFPDKHGIPITLSKSTVYGDIPDEKRNLKDFNKFNITINPNGFTGKDYSDDKEGLKCPFHAHIRKVNPRIKDHLFAENPPAVIIRRSIPYKYSAENTGIFFMCFQKNIHRQFSKIQQNWCNNDDLYNPNEKSNGIDPIAGQNSNKKGQNWNKDWGANAKPRIKFSIQDFVEMRGGEFFYAPSLQLFDAPLTYIQLLDELDEIRESI